MRILTKRRSLKHLVFSQSGSSNLRIPLRYYILSLLFCRVLSLLNIIWHITLVITIWCVLLCSFLSVGNTSPSICIPFCIIRFTYWLLSFPIPPPFWELYLRAFTCRRGKKGKLIAISGNTVTNNKLQLVFTVQ